MYCLFVFGIAIVGIGAAPPPNDLSSPMIMELYGKPMVVLRDKRAPFGYYPQRSMMFTGFYRPTRYSDQAGGIYAQGSSIGGGAYFTQPRYSKGRHESIDEPEISSAEAEAAPQQPEINDEEQEEGAIDQPQFHLNPEPESPSDEEAIPKPNKGPTKKGKKMPRPVEHEEPEDDEEEDEEPITVFTRPIKGRGNKNYPTLNNLFPMVFTFPGSAGRRGGSSSSNSPGLITAIANSYSTGKGGVASSVAAAYGASPTKKQRRISQAQ